MNLIMPAEFERRMKEIAEKKVYDNEDRHIKADDLLCKVLNSLGYEKGVEIFKEMDKWYA